MRVAEGAQKYQAQYSQASVEVFEPVELYEPQETQRTRRGQALPVFPRSRTAPQFPHVHSTVGLGTLSTGGAVGTPSTRGAGRIAPRDVEIDEAVVAGCEVTQPLRFGQGDYMK